MDGIEEIEKIEDPAEQAREIGRRLGEIPKYQERLRIMRQKAVLKMKASGLSYAQIGQELGGLHRNRIQQIAEGRTAGGQGGGKAKADAGATE